MPAIRKAIRSDAERLARLAEKTFRDTFGAANTPEDMELHCRANYSEGIQAAEICSPDTTTLLSEDDGRLVGFAQLRWGSAPDCVLAASAGEVQRLYVLGDWHGRGIAQALMQACLEEMRAHGCDVVWLGVWERNPRAMAFYRKFGFAAVGDHVFPLGHDPQRDIVMARSVETAGSRPGLQQ